MLKYILTENVTYEEYQRTKFNLIDILTAVGGLFNSVFLIGFAFTISFSYNLFLSSIIRQVYHFRAKFDVESISTKIKGDKDDASSTEGEDDDVDDTKDEPDEKKNRRLIYQGDSIKEEMLNDYQAKDKSTDLGRAMYPYTYEEKLYKTDRKKIKDSMKRTLGYKGKADFFHKTWDIIKHHVCLRSCTDRKKLRSNPKTRNSLFFEKGK